MFGKSIVAAIVSRYSHDGSCSISCQYVITDPNRYCFTGKRIDGICSTEYTGNATVGDTFALRTFLGAVEVGIYFRFLFGSSDLCYQFAFRSQYHKGNAEHRICTGSKDSKFKIAVFYFELYFSAFRTAYPVLLSFFQWISPVDSVQPVQQALCVCGYTQTPLAHLFLNDRITATFADPVHYFIVSQYGS